MSRGSRATLSRLGTALTAIAAVALAAVTLYPGWYSYDSAWQLMQARTHAYSNLQPPTMPLAWSAILAMGLPPGALLVAHLAALAAGMALIGRSLRRAHALLLPLLLLWPPFLVLFGHLWIDVSMAAALTLAAGWIAWSRTGGRPRLAWLALLPLAYAIGVRHNAVVAALPLLVLLLDGAAGAPRGAPKKAATAVALAILAFVGSAALSRMVDARPAPAWTPTAIWDLSAASVASGEMLLPAGMRGPALTVGELRPLVNPDTSTDILMGARSGLNAGIITPMPEEAKRELLQRWLRLPFTHPAAWMEHRAAVAWSLFGPQRAGKTESLVIVPQVTPFAGNPPIQPNASAANSLLVAFIRATRHTPLCTPLAYLLLAAAAMVLALRRGFAGDRALVVALAASAWLHALPLAFIVPSAEWRYTLWSMFAGLLAFVLALSGRRAIAARPVA